jgi:hypothetical protein
VRFRVRINRSSASPAIARGKRELAEWSLDETGKTEAPYPSSVAQD